MRTDGVPRAVIPTLEQMALPFEERLASLWERNAGGVRAWFKDFAEFRFRFVGDKAQVELEGACAVPKTLLSAGLQVTESVRGLQQ